MYSKTAALISFAGLFGIGVAATSALGASSMYASHPFLHRTQKELNMVKFLLSRATHDCGGHRAIAVQKIGDALNEVQAAIAYADAHPQEDSRQAP